MTLDYISDLHIAFLYAKETRLSTHGIQHHFAKTFSTKSSDYLLVAGDISEYPDRTFEFLKLLKDTFGYKKIIFVFGNHDLWLTSRNLQNTFNFDSDNKMSYVKNWLMRNNPDQDIVLLDGDVIEIEGVKIGGAMGWYDTVYDTEVIQPYISPYSGLNREIYSTWASCMNDYKFIFPIRPTYEQMTTSEHAKVRKVLGQNPDVVLTHINPLIGDQYVHPMYKGDRTNTFYQMDFRKEIEEYKPKFWVFGHQHKKAEYTYGDTKLFLNPYGYPSEALGCFIQHIEV